MQRIGIVAALIALAWMPSLFGGISGLTRARNADIALVPAMPTPPALPTPACPQLLRSRLIVYTRGRVTNDEPTPSNVRAGPGTLYDIVGEIAAGKTFFVLEGPECSQRYTWYRVRAGEIDGWIAEGSNTSYYVEPYPPG